MRRSRELAAADVAAADARDAPGSDRDGLERLAGAESRATSALHAARDDQAELRRIFSRSTSPYEPSDE